MTYNEDILKDLSEEERNEVLKILNEFSKTGESKSYENILYNDYEEIPVDIETFLHDPEYLGKGLTTDEGKFTVFPYWEETLKKIFPNNIDVAYHTIVLTGGIGLGKAQPLDAKVLTADGYKSMGDLTLNDKVYGSDGKLHNLLGIFPQGRKKIYKVTFTDKTSTECCDEHLWTILPKNQKSKAKTIELKDLIDKPLYRLNQGKYKERLYYIPMTEPIQFEKKDLFISPYILGCLIGDGGLTHSAITLTSADEEIIDRFSSELHQDYVLNKLNSKYSYRLSKKNHTSFIDIDGKLKQTPNLYVKEIERLNLNVKSIYKHIPQEYLYNSVENRIALLQGLLDTDGTITKSGSTQQFNTTSKQLKDDIIFLIESLGGSAWYSEIQPYYRKAGEIERHAGNISYTITFKLPKYIKPFSIQRKLCRINPNSNPPSRAIDSIEYIGEKECQCIYIDSSEHLYLTNNFIVTHNTMVAMLMILYQLYKMICLKDPYVYYGLQPIDKITFALMNITLEASRGVAWDKIQQLLQASPWFMRHGTVKGTTNVEWQPPKGIELIPGSLPRHILGRAVYSAFMDEVSFQPNQDLEKQIRKAKDLVNAADIRMQSRFMKGIYNPTILILASSKRSEQSYLETFIDNKRKNESKTTLIIDEPQWVIRTDKDSEEKFQVAVGNKFLNNELIPLGATEKDIQKYIDRGYKIINVPIGYYEQFNDDIDMALTDIAGISTSNTTNYISGERLLKVISESFSNAFNKDIIEVGNDPKDNSEYKDFFDLSKIESKYKRYPLFIHLDMSISGDKTGIAGVWITDKKSSDNTQPSRDLCYKIPFVVSIKAPKGYQVSFAKNRNFIRWLHEQGFNIQGISSDTFQSYDLQQQLKAEGFNCSIISVDRVEDRVCKPYQYFKSTIYEERIEIPKNNLLQQELIGLKRDTNGRVDHDASGINSKDSADACCGAIWNASQHAEEFAYNFGEDLEATVKISTDKNDDAFKKQIQVDFQQSLQEMFDPIKSQYNLEPEKPVEINKNQSQLNNRDFQKAKAIQLLEPNIVASKPVILTNDMIIW